MAGPNQAPSNAGAGVPPNTGAGSDQVPSSDGGYYSPFNSRRYTANQSPYNGYYSSFNSQSSPPGYYSPFNSQSSTPNSSFPSGQSSNGSFPSRGGSPYYCCDYHPFGAGRSYGNNPSPSDGNSPYGDLSPAETRYYSSIAAAARMAGSRNFSARNHQPPSGVYINSGVSPARNPLPPSDSYYRNGYPNCDYIQPESNSRNSSYGANPLELELNGLRLSSPPDSNALRDMQRIRAQYPAWGHSAGRALTSSVSPRSSRSSVSGYPLSYFTGRILSVAYDQHGHRYLQSKFRNPDDVRMIFSEVKDDVCELMVKQFGSLFMQKFFAVVDENQMNHFLSSLLKDDEKFKDTCTDMHGTKAVQKLLDHLTTQAQRSVVVSALRRLTLPLIKDQNGQHVIQYCLKYFPDEDNKHILNIVANNCLEVATDKSGCCVIQQCLNYSIGEPTNRIMLEIISNALILSENPYGNYVVQYVLGFRIPRVTWEILKQLSGNFAYLSLDKYGSNVVEQCLKQSMSDQAIFVIDELMRSPILLDIFQDPFGNFVAQCAIIVSEKDERMGQVHQKLLRFAQMNAQSLHSHPHGKRVLSRARGSGVLSRARGSGFKFARK